MRKTVLIIILLSCSYCFGQLEKNDDEYLFQTYDIFEVTLLNELIISKHEFDSIQVLESKAIYTIDSNWNILQYPAEYSITINRKNQKIKTIKTEYLKAEFSYNLIGKIEKIKFIYNKEVRHPLYEGTTDYYEFKYENGRLINCFDYGVYGKNHPFRYIVKYY